MRLTHELLALAQRDARAGIWNWDLVTGKCSWSDELFVLYGLDPATMTDCIETWRGLLHPEDKERAEQDIYDALEKGNSLYSEYRIVTPAGETKWILSVGDARRNDQGDAIGLSGLSVDISEMHEEERRAHHRDALYRALIQNAADAVFVYDMNARFIEVNQRACDNLGYTEQELLNMGIADVTPEFDLAARQPMWHQLEVGRPYSMVSTHRRKDGSTFPVELRIVLLEVDGEKIMMALVQDITERKRIEEELRIAAVAFSSESGVIITDADARILRVNAAFTRLTGYAEEEVLGLKPSILSSGRHDRQFFKHMWSALLGRGYWQGEIWNKHRNGKVFAEMLTITTIRGDDGKPTHFVGSFTDITDSKLAEAEIHRLAYYDSLTKLPNRRLLQDRLSHALTASGRSGQYGSLFFIDLDNFKGLNDTRGHDVGDQLLLEVASRLRATVREGDTVARLGGDEFVVLLEGMGSEPEEAARLAKQMGDKLRDSMERPFLLGEYEYLCRLSIGVSLFHRNDSVEELLKHADLALYQAKNAGRNTLRFFDPEMQAVLENRNRLEMDLRQALARGELELFYQPQVDAARKVVGVEALLRWHHPVRGLVPPGEFIGVAEDTGLILPIGQWVLETACFQLKHWEQEECLRDIQIAVNVSPRQFRQADFPAQVKDVLQRSGIDPACLKLELTESLVLEDVQDAIAKMQAIKQLGVSFSMDDFGTGYSSLSYLADLPLAQLKIDRSFVRNLPGKSNDELITRTIISMGRGLAMHVIAEGVESEAQREFLEAYGCNTYQGYLFGQPVPAKELERSLQCGVPAG